MTALKGWLAAAHPVPLVLVLALTALIGVASSDGEPDATRLALLLAAMALSQLAIGWSNDYLDRETDAAGQPWKPVPSGLIDARVMPPAIVAVLLGSLALGVLLGPLPLLLLVVGTGCGLAYNLGLKDTSSSGLPFILALGVLPAYVWTALDVYRDDFLLLYAIGTPLALAVHVANGVPDIATDRSAGRKGLAAILGRSRSLLLLQVCFFVSGVAGGIELGGKNSSAFVLFCLLAGLGGFAYHRDDRTGDVWAFRLFALAGIVLATAWLAAV